MPFGELATRWTVRIALALYALSLAVRVNAKGCSSREAWARALWTGGLVVFAAHLYCAFEFFHHWSHRAAYDTTASRTADVTGFARGGGLYANYLFALIWAGDAIWWWRNQSSYRARSAVIEWSIQGFMAFMVFNATIVFGIGAIRWMGLAGCVVLIGAFILAQLRGTRSGRIL